MKKAALHNLGCKVNAYETEAMQEMLDCPFQVGGGYLHYKYMYCYKYRR